MDHSGLAQHCSSLVIEHILRGLMDKDSQSFHSYPAILEAVLEAVGVAHSLVGDVDFPAVDTADSDERVGSVVDM